MTPTAYSALPAPEALLAINDVVVAQRQGAGNQTSAIRFRQTSGDGTSVFLVCLGGDITLKIYAVDGTFTYTGSQACDGRLGASLATFDDTTYVVDLYTSNPASTWEIFVTRTRK